MKVLGIVCSVKKMGNSEIAVKRILSKCRASGAEVKMIRLADWNFSQCKGCFNCLFKNTDCTINDNLIQFAEMVFQYDKLVIASPTYLLYPPGIIKLLIDRVGVFVKQLEKAKATRRFPESAVLVGLAGVVKWDAFIIPMMSLFAKVISGYQADIVDRELLYHPGPGEILLDEKSLNRLDAMSTKLMNAEVPVEIPLELNGKLICPVCGSNSFIISGGEEKTSVECPLCGVNGTLINSSKIILNRDSLANNRLTEAGAREFVNSWIMNTRGTYMKQFKKIALLKGEYKNNAIKLDWELP